MSEFLRNCWYMAAWSEELTSAPLGFRILNEPIVFFRGVRNQVIALGGMCPHRFAPLALGKVQGDMIACPYHGLGFDSSGACVHSPFGIDIPSGTGVTAYPAVERHDAIWVWLGAPHLADEAAVPDFGYHTDPGMRVVRGRSHVTCNYELITDNLMDLTHARFLHPFFGDGTRGGDSRPDVKFSQDGETVFSSYAYPPYAPSPFSKAIMPPVGGRLVSDRQSMRWTAPAAMFLDIRLSWSDAPGKDEILQPSTHVLTPESEGLTHYFWASGIPADAMLTDDEHFEALRFAFDEEDAPMLVAVGQMMNGREFWDMHPAILAFDQGSVRVRRILRQKIRAEQRGAVPA